MTKHPLTSGLNACIIRSEEAEAAFSFLERREHPVLPTPSVGTYEVQWMGRRERLWLSCKLNQEENKSVFHLLGGSLQFCLD